jgi:guanylate kinase
LFRIAEELKKLKEFRNQIADENQRYVESHPEFSSLMDNFITAVFDHKPKDIIKFSIFYFSTLHRNEAQIGSGFGGFGPCPVIIAGPSGVGKGTLISKLITTFPHIFAFSVSHTTRAQRQDEIEGINYYFISKPEFEDAVERGEFVEYAKVHTNFYGTSFRSIEKVSFC